MIEEDLIRSIGDREEESPAVARLIEIGTAEILCNN